MAAPTASPQLPFSTLASVDPGTSSSSDLFTALNARISSLESYINTLLARFEQFAAAFGNGLISGGAMTVDGATLAVTVAAGAAFVAVPITWGTTVVGAANGMVDAATNYLWLWTSGAFTVTQTDTVPTPDSTNGTAVLYGTSVAAGGIAGAPTALLAYAGNALTGAILEVPMADANQTLTADQLRYPVIKVTGALTDNRQLLIPGGQIVANRTVINGTSGSHSVTVKHVSDAGSGIALASGDAKAVFSEGTQVQDLTAGYV